MMLERIDPEQTASSAAPTLTPIALLRELGLERPTNPQCRECGTILREWFGDPRKIQGLHKWRIPFREPERSVHPNLPNHFHI